MHAHTGIYAHTDVRYALCRTLISGEQLNFWVCLRFEPDEFLTQPNTK